MLPIGRPVRRPAPECLQVELADLSAPVGFDEGSYDEHGAVRPESGVLDHVLLERDARQYHQPERIREYRVRTFPDRAADEQRRGRVDVVTVSSTPSKGWLPVNADPSRRANCSMVACSLCFATFSQSLFPDTLWLYYCCKGIIYFTGFIGATHLVVSPGRLAVRSEHGSLNDHHDLKLDLDHWNWASSVCRKLDTGRSTSPSIRRKESFLRRVLQFQEFRSER